MKETSGSAADCRAKRGGRLLCCRYVLGGDGNRNKLRKHQGKTTSSNDGDKRSSAHVRFPPNPTRLVRDKHNCHDDLYWPSSIEVGSSVKQEARGAEIQRFLGWGLMRRGHTKKGVLLNCAILWTTSAPASGAPRSMVLSAEKQTPITPLAISQFRARGPNTKWTYRITRRSASNPQQIQMAAGLAPRRLAQI